MKRSNMEELNPVRKRRMMPGVSAYGWSMVFLAGSATAIALSTTYAVLSAESGFATSAAELTLRNGMFFVFIFGMGIPIAVFSVQTAREAAHEYTTNPFKYPHLDLCDWRTGIVVREAGMPLISWTEFIRRRRGLRRAARGYHKEA